MNGGIAIRTWRRRVVSKQEGAPYSKGQMRPQLGQLTVRDNNSNAGRGQLVALLPSRSVFSCISHGPAIERLVAVTQAAGWSVARWNERPFCGEYP